MTINYNDWNRYLENELPVISNILKKKEITLDDNQPHTKGERFLMRASTTTSGRKLILIGNHTQLGKVVIKVANETDGIKEIDHERRCRQLLHQIDFSYDTFLSPKEHFYFRDSGYQFLINEFITQPCSFLERPLDEQFKLSLRALKAQEQTRATTSNHFKKIASVFGAKNSQDYLKMFEAFIEKAANLDLENTKHNLLKVQKLLTTNQSTIEQYSGFLTHTDFVPHNFRIRDELIYLLDFSSMRFGNKHEGWARFLNFMTLYNRPLEEYLLSYVAHNRSAEEALSLKLMRLYRLGEIIAYYADTIKISEGNLLKLNEARVAFWTEVLLAELSDKRVASDIVNRYCLLRDELRSLDEKNRQIGLH